MCSLPFASVAVCAIDIGWTDEPFDRLIVANAKANRNAWLITADETIRQHYPQAVW